MVSLRSDLISVQSENPWLKGFENPDALIGAKQVIRESTLIPVKKEDYNQNKARSGLQPVNLKHCKNHSESAKPQK